MAGLALAPDTILRKSQPTPVWHADSPAGLRESAQQKNLPNGKQDLPEDGEFVTLKQYVTERLLRNDVPAMDRLWLLLTFLYSPRKAREAAQTLLSEFGSVGSLLAASRERLNESLPGCDELWTLLKAAHSLALSTLFEDTQDRTVLDNSEKISDYLRLMLAHERREVVRLLLLGKGLRLLKDELHSEGSPTSTPIYRWKIMESVLRAEASGIIIVHNHPSGVPQPSIQDIDETRNLAADLRSFGITLHDHFIVGRNTVCSMKAWGFIP